jgi:hypothetical protein
MMLMMLVTIIEKGPVKDLINPREDPRNRKKILKKHVIRSVMVI